MKTNIDEQVDETLERCISEGSKKSFFVFAGAGSGKTHSLTELLRKIDAKWSDKLRTGQKQVAVITYTNAATDEIVRRLGYNNLFHVSTIHSFVWDVIKSYQFDIKKYFKELKTEELKDLQEKQDKAKNKSTKTYLSNQTKIERLTERLGKLDQDVKKFTYNPNSDNLSKDSLSHSDVITIGSRMILENQLLQKVIVQQYPFFLVDESQDTKKELVLALLEIQKNYKDSFTLGFFGDIKQRIYTDGADNMPTLIDDSWDKPIKQMNYRCAKRIIELSNRIALKIDDNGTQQARDDAPEGFVHLFLVNNSLDYNTDRYESQVCIKMKELTSDDDWLPERNEVKVLTLEHLMAAKRLGFAEFHDAISHVNKYQMSYQQGEIPELSAFKNAIFPLLEMLQNGKGAESLDLLKNYSPLLDLSEGDNPIDSLRKCEGYVKELSNIIDTDSSIKDVINFICGTNLFRIDNTLAQASKLSLNELDEESLENETLVAWVKVMDLKISQLKKYYNYTQRKTKYDTHQGVKGLEFPRVLVIINDDEAKGFMFSYDKIFGVKKPSPTDVNHMENGEDSAISRTTRLLYVTCTRAKDSLALLMYTPDPNKAKKTALDNEWFKEEEITIL